MEGDLRPDHGAGLAGAVAAPPRRQASAEADGAASDSGQGGSGSRHVEPRARGRRGRAAPVVVPPVREPLAHAPILGIDLGTSHCRAACAVGGDARAIRTRDGLEAIPCVVALDARGRLVVGRIAEAQRLANPHNTVHAARLLMGRPFASPGVQALRPHLPYDLVEREDGLTAVELSGQRIALEEIAGLVLREVKEAAQEQLAARLDRAILAAPAHHDAGQRRALREAAALAGLTVERIVEEPLAIAIAVARRHRRELGRRVAVYDLGGSTFDLSILERTPNGHVVVANGGDTALGGVDLDRAVLSALLERYERRAGRPFEGDGVALSRLVHAAERCKCALSDAATTTVHLPYLGAHEGVPLDLEETFAREELAALARPLVARTIGICADVLAAARLEPGDVEEVILAGGASRTGVVGAEVERFFGRQPLVAEHPAEDVARGAALLALPPASLPSPGPRAPH